MCVHLLSPRSLTDALLHWQENSLPLAPPGKSNKRYGVGQNLILVFRRVDSLEKTDAGRDWGQEKKGMTEDEMAGWHHRLDGQEFE